MDFGLGRTYNWVFHVAYVMTPILGFDYFAACKFNINVHNASVTDKHTNVSIRDNATVIKNVSYISSVLPSSSYLQLLNEFPALLSEKPIHPPKHNIVHRICTTGGPVYCTPRCLIPHISASIKPAFAKLLADGIISVSCSPWCCPLHCVPKKDDSWRPTADYSPLNNLTILDTYPLPHLQSFTDQLHNKTIFSKIDLKDAFLQIPVHPDDIAKTTITTPFGAFQYHYMSFGLSGASQLFQQLIDTALQDIKIRLPNGHEKDISVFAYINDILLASSSHENHFLELGAVFQCLTDYGLRISPIKCEFGACSMEFLRHLIDENGIASLPEKVAAMRSYETPTTAKELRRYLGMINFYRRFLPRSAETLQPLYDLIKNLNSLPKNTKISWSNEQLQAFEKSKSDLADASNLAYPALNEPLYLAADASDTAVAAVLY